MGNIYVKNLSLIDNLVFDDLGEITVAPEQFVNLSEKYTMYELYKSTDLINAVSGDLALLSLDGINILTKSESAEVVNIQSEYDLKNHTNNVSNPHTVNNTQVGLGNVTDDAQLKRAAGDINGFAEKVTPVNEDMILLEDSEDSYNKKKSSIQNVILKIIEGHSYYVEDDTETGTTSEVFDEKLRLTTPVIEAGDYIVQFTYKYWQSDNDKDHEVEVWVDGITNIHHAHLIPHKDTNREYGGGFKKVTLTAGIHYVSLGQNRQVGSSSRTVYLSDCRIELRRLG